MAEALKEKMRTMSKGGPYITGVLSTYEPYVRFNNPEIELLLGLHPNPEKNARNIEYMEVRLSDPLKKRTLYIKTVGKEADSVSYKLCIRVLFSKHIRDEVEKHTVGVVQSLRNAVDSTKRLRFYLDNIAETRGCAICEGLKKLEIDHCGKCFEQIVDEFMAESGTAYASVQISTENKFADNNWYIGLTDPTFSQRWVEYHDREAEFRFLCKRCNTSAGMSGYKRLQGD